MKPWERQHGERSKAFRLFCLYRDIGPGRTVDKALDAWAAEGGDKCSQGQGERYCSLYKWVSRAAAYDDYIDKVHCDQRDRDIIEMNKRQGEDFHKFQLEIRRLMKDRIESGELSPNQINDLTRAYDRASKGERLARGEVTNRTETDGKREVKISGELNQPDVRRGITDLIKKIQDGSGESGSSGNDSE
jgi:hypothetical protein